MNFQLYNDKVWTFPIKPQNAAGVVQPWPAAASPSAISSNPASLGAIVALTGGGPNFSLVLTPIPTCFRWPLISFPPTSPP